MITDAGGATADSLLIVRFVEPSGLGELNVPSLDTVARSALNEALVDPATASDAMSSIFREIGLGWRLDGNAGVVESGIQTLEEHYRLFDAAYYAYFGDHTLPQKVDAILYAVTRWMHDISKTECVEKGIRHEHEQHNARVAQPAMRVLGFTEDEVDLSLAVMTGIKFGGLAASAMGYKPPGVKNPIEETVTEIIDRAGRQDILSLPEIARLMLMQFMCDAVSYTSLVNVGRPNESRLAYMFDYDATKQTGKLTFKKPISEAVAEVFAEIDRQE